MRFFLLKLCPHDAADLDIDPDTGQRLLIPFYHNRYYVFDYKSISDWIMRTHISTTCFLFPWIHCPLYTIVATCDDFSLF